MLIYHQCGHNFVWNIQSVRDDDVGEGLIVSPVNVEADKIRDRVPEELLPSSWMDPQFFLPNDSKGCLSTYPFFPANVLDRFTTVDFREHAEEVARSCVEFQHDLGLRYVVVPTRYYDDLPEEHLDQATELFVEPFARARADIAPGVPLLLTIIAKGVHLEDGALRDELLSWATSHTAINGIYLILDNSFPSKQIKDAAYLAGVLRLIRVLRRNGLEVHVGYTGIEGLLYAAAEPTSVSVGSYENLRSFGTLRLETRERTERRGPRPRIYSGRLLQWIDETAIPPIRELVPDWRDLFDESPYKHYLLDPNNTLHFQRSEIYKHYFCVFNDQVTRLTGSQNIIADIHAMVDEALGLFGGIRAAGIYLDADSDGSHLPAWHNALAMYEARPE